MDTHAVPPRSIWTHPHEDEQFLRDHPDVREKVGNTPHEYSAPDGLPPGHSSASKYAPPKGKRGFFGKLKDKAIGTKEEREAEKQHTAMVRNISTSTFATFHGCATDSRTASSAICREPPYARVCSDTACTIRVSTRRNGDGWDDGWLFNGWHGWR